MNLTEAKVALNELANKLVERSQGVAAMELVEEFKVSYGSELDDLSAGLFDDWLKSRANDVVHKVGRGHSTQLTLPGMGHVDAFVTVPDGEAGYRRKKLIHATDADLDADERIHRDNVTAATKAFDEVAQRNRVLRPVMRSQGFNTAGEAITWLNAGDS